MTKLWQLKKISSDEPQNEPQPLPESWGPIFGMSGFQDKLEDLSWLGEEYADLGWFVVGESSTTAAATSTTEDLMWDRAKKLLQDSDWSVLPDVPMTSDEKIKWIEYRQKLRDIRLQPEFPNNIEWPVSPK